MVPRLECITWNLLSVASLRVPICLFLRFVYPHRLLSSSLVLRVVSIASLALNKSLGGRLRDDRRRSAKIANEILLSYQRW